MKCFCQNERWTKAHTFHEAPSGETSFGFLKSKTYFRELFRCEDCGHFQSVHELSPADLYQEDYVSATYQGLEGIRANFRKVANLPPEKSDNAGRVARIQRYGQRFMHISTPRTVLDVGAGIGIFLFRMKEAGWICTGLDPDPRATQHLREDLEIPCVQNDFLKVNASGKFSLVTLNKVLEHVPNPGVMLGRTKEWLAPEGLVYVEVPDGEGAWEAGPQRQEFFIDHFHIFTEASLKHLARNNGFEVLTLEKIREPSGKYTLCTLLK